MDVGHGIYHHLVTAPTSGAVTRPLTNEIRNSVGTGTTTETSGSAPSDAVTKTLTPTPTSETDSGRFPRRYNTGNKCTPSLLRCLN